ncbi:hypothetical protein NBRC116590_16500 [Pelagimonas sp. KU-00592-HH]
MSFTSTRAISAQPEPLSKPKTEEEEEHKPKNRLPPCNGVNSCPRFLKCFRKMKPLEA